MKDTLQQTRYFFLPTAFLFVLPFSSVQAVLAQEKVHSSSKSAQIFNMGVNGGRYNFISIISIYLPHLPKSIIYSNNSLIVRVFEIAILFIIAKILEATKIAFNMGMDKQIMVHPDNGIFMPK